MIDPKLQRIIDKLKAKEQGEKSWLETHLVAITGTLCFAVGMIFGHFA